MIRNASIVATMLPAVDIKDFAQYHAPVLETNEAWHSL
jgi:hypothetical protein